MFKAPAILTIAANASIGILAALCVAAGSLIATDSMTARAQSAKPADEPRNSPPLLDKRKPIEAPEKFGPPEAPSGGASEAPAKLKSALGNTPKTADQKAKQLADLYAQLATAEDEAAAKKFGDQIERLWHHSGSDTVNLLMERSTIALRKNQPELAEKLLDRVVALAPDYAEGFNQRAYFHFVRNNYDAAVGDLRRVLALDPNHYKALEGLAQIWRDTGNKKGALGVVRQLIDVHPFAAGARSTYDELKREVEGQGI